MHDGSKSWPYVFLVPWVRVLRISEGSFDPFFLFEWTLYRESCTFSKGVGDVYIQRHK